MSSPAPHFACFREYLVHDFPTRTAVSSAVRCACAPMEMPAKNVATVPSKSKVVRFIPSCPGLFKFASNRIIYSAIDFALV
jgi:hypothetical protein